MYTVSHFTSFLVILELGFATEVLLVVVGAIFGQNLVFFVQQLEKYSKDTLQSQLLENFPGKSAVYFYPSLMHSCQLRVIFSFTDVLLSTPCHLLSHCH